MLEYLAEPVYSYHIKATYLNWLSKTLYTWINSTIFGQCLAFLSILKELQSYNHHCLL